jgi:hypothetical protein
MKKIYNQNLKLAVAYKRCSKTREMETQHLGRQNIKVKRNPNYPSIFLGVSKRNNLVVVFDV